MQGVKEGGRKRVQRLDPHQCEAQESGGRRVGRLSDLLLQRLAAYFLDVAAAGSKVSGEAAQVAPLAQRLLAHLYQLEQARVGQLPRDKPRVPVA